MQNVNTGLSKDDYEPMDMEEVGGVVDDILDLEAGFEIEDMPLELKTGLDQGIAILQVTIRRPFSVASVAAIVWSLLPYTIAVSAMLLLIQMLIFSPPNSKSYTSITAGHVGFLWFYLLMALAGVLLNEKVLKVRFKEVRPRQSACKGYGMPSGHSTNSYAWMVWWILGNLMNPCAYFMSSFYSIITALILLAPVPVARVYLGDHTYRQVFAGCVVGTILGGVAVPIQYLLFPQAVPLWL